VCYTAYLSKTQQNIMTREFLIGEEEALTSGLLVFSRWRLLSSFNQLLLWGGGGADWCGMEREDDRAQTSVLYSIFDLRHGIK